MSDAVRVGAVIGYCIASIIWGAAACIAIYYYYKGTK